MASAGDLALLTLAASGTALATGLGAVPVFLLGPRAEALRPFLWGIASGLMSVASVLGLLLPALDEGSALQVAGGLAAGVGFFFLASRITHGMALGTTGLNHSGVRSSLLVGIVLFVHSFPEGLAIGTAYASETKGLGLFVILAIALQNVPEGTAQAIPMAEAGFSRARQFWAAVATSVPQPIGAVAAYLLVAQVSSLLPLSFAFAAGAMFSLVALEMVPQAFTASTWRGATAGAVAGGAAMAVLALALGV